MNVRLRFRPVVLSDLLSMFVAVRVCGFFWGGLGADVTGNLRLRRPSMLQSLIS